MSDRTIEEAMVALRHPGIPVQKALTGTPNAPGLYAIHTDTLALAQLGLDDHDPGRPIYVGLASKSLRKRDTRQHFASSATGGSTVRRSFAVLLADDLALTARPRGGKAKPSQWRSGTKDQEIALTEWMHSHLTLAVWPSTSGTDLDAAWPSTPAIDLGAIETTIIQAWCPPLNIAKNPQPWQHLRNRRARMAVVALHTRS